MSWVAIGGFGEGLGEGIAAALAPDHDVVGLSRSGTSSATAFGVGCDLCDVRQTNTVLAALIAERGAPRAYVHAPHVFTHSSFEATAPEVFEHAWRTSMLTAVHATQAVLPSMLAGGTGNLAFLGATASIRAGARFAAFASSKFAVRGLAQSLAREFGPRGIHVAHLLIDAVVDGPQAMNRVGRPGDMEPNSVGASLRHLFDQPPDAWTHELDLRPATERW